MYVGVCMYNRSHGKIAITVITSNGGKNGERRFVCRAPKKR